MNIYDVKANIETSKANIQKKLSNIDDEIFDKTIAHIMALYDKYGTSEMFNRKDVETATGLKATRAYEIVKLLLDNGIIRLVKGHGKGKYSFK